MKKTIVFLTSLLLISCSTSETNLLNDSNTELNSKKENSGKTIDPQVGYTSQYNISLFGEKIRYTFVNTSPFQIKIKAYVGLAYYDSGNPISHDYMGFNLDDGNYPLLYSSNVIYGNTILSDELILPAAPNGSGFNVDSMIGHFPISNIGPNVFPQNIAFSFNSSGATNEELKLLYNAGKIYYISYEVVDVNNNTVANGFLNSGFPAGIGSFGTLPSNWSHITYDANFNRELISENNSKEIVVTDDQTSFGSVANFPYSGSNYQLRMHSYPDIVVLEVYPN